MRPIPPHVARAIEQELPRLARAVAGSQDDVLLSWADFGDDPDLLYHCVWYALCQGKAVVIEPPI
ncbi:MAG TPA: hypothetical protein VHE55_10080 [Fimbriimonadaceae bacterium]|nr:hypothetical protein [Fimbriimonadaceae bacterium]